jgi:hypothetical protein
LREEIGRQRQGCQHKQDSNAQEALVAGVPALLQEGSVIETESKITRGEVPKPFIVRVFMETSPRGIAKTAMPLPS